MLVGVWDECCQEKRTIGLWELGAEETIQLFLQWLVELR